MNISTRLVLAASVPVLMAFVVGAALLYSWRTEETAEANGRAVQRIMRSARELDNLTRSYVLYQNERPRQQFLAEHDTLTRLIGEARITDPEQVRLLSNVRDNSELVRQTFLRLVEAYERPAGEDDDPVLVEARERLTGHLFVRSNEVASDALRLERLLDDRIAATHRNAFILITSVTVAAALLLTFVLVRTARRITAALTALRRGAETVGSGNLDYRIAMPPGDEMGTLARSFDLMTERLRTVTVSKDELQTEVAERKRAEEAQRLLAGAAAALASSLDYEATLERVADLALPLLADYCIVDVLEGGKARRVATVHVGSGKAALARRLRDFPPDLARGVGVPEVLQTGEPRFEPAVTEEHNTAIAQSPEHLALMRDLGARSRMTLPLIARGQVVGAITFAMSDSGRQYTHGDLLLGLELARHCALAIENAQLYRGEAVARKRAEEREETLRAVMDSMTEALFAVDADLRVRFVNTHAGDLLRAPNESFVGRPVEEVLRFADESGSRPFDLTSTLLGVLERRQPLYEHETWLHLPNRRMPVDLTLAPWGGHGAVVLFRDITRRKEVDELRESIVSTVSHELRTPLHHIKGFASTLLQEDVQWDRETERDFLTTIDREADRLARLVDDLLEMSRLESGRLQVERKLVSVAGLIDSGLTLAAPFLAKHQVAAEVRVKSYVTGDQSRLERVLVNLLENAAKYSPEGTSVRVAARHHGREVLVSVADEGPGIAPQDRQRIFEKFVRLETRGRAVPGTGLGLPICKAIVEQHGGRIWVESAQGNGSVFCFTLPVTVEPQPGPGVGWPGGLAGGAADRVFLARVSASLSA